MKKVLKGKSFADVEKVKQTGKQKNSRDTKRYKNWPVQNSFEQWKNVLIGV